MGKKKSPGTKQTSYGSIFIYYSEIQRHGINQSHCAQLKEFNLEPSRKERSTPEESQGSSGGVIANTLKKAHLIFQLQK